ncbi:MAG: hypothetical protein SW833_15555 [Cyanobacteriota bacterium]|nr:hypothetical protein [Cyanobacteriota bacterium]
MGTLPLSLAKWRSRSARGTTEAQRVSGRQKRAPSDTDSTNLLAAGRVKFQLYSPLCRASEG